MAQAAPPAVVRKNCRRVGSFTIPVNAIVWFYPSRLAGELLASQESPWAWVFSIVRSDRKGSELVRQLYHRTASTVKKFRLQDPLRRSIIAFATAGYLSFDDLFRCPAHKTADL